MFRIIIKNNKKRNELMLNGIKAAWPICLGYFPLGFACGVLAQKSGLCPFEIGLMSIFVFAGSAQFIAISMFNNSATIFSIIFATFIINLRHILMSSSLTVYLRGASRKFLLLFSYGVTDETFAINLDKFKTGTWNHSQALTVNHIANVVWVISNIAGGYSGSMIPINTSVINYSLTAMFISLFVFQIKNKIYVLAGIIAGISSVYLSFVFQSNIYVIFATLFATTIGYILDSFRKEG